MPLSSEWDTSTGLLDNESITIQSAIFGYDTDYNKGQTCCMIWQVLTSNGTQEKVLLPLGDGWEPVAGGAQVKREDGADRPVSRNAAYGQFLESIKVLPDAVAALEKLPTGPKVAQTWVGVSFHVIRKEEVFKITRNGVMVEQKASRLIADAFLGIAGQAIGQAMPQAQAIPQAQPVAQVAPVAAPVAPVATPAVGVGVIAPPVGIQPVAAPGVPMQPPPVTPMQQAAQSNGWGNLNQDQLNALAGIAQQSADHGAFMLAAFASPGVQGDSVAEAGVMDTTPNGWYAKLRGQ